MTLEEVKKIKEWDYISAFWETRTFLYLLRKWIVIYCQTKEYEKSADYELEVYTCELSDISYCKMDEIVWITYADYLEYKRLKQWI